MNESNINALIIENDDKALHYLRSILQTQYPFIHILGTAKTVGDGIKLIENTTAELIFMDIELDDGYCFEILDQIKNKNFELIFTTGFDNFYQKAIEHFAFNYILKPIDPAILNKVVLKYLEVKQRHFTESKLEHFKHFLQQEKSKILLQTGSSYISVSIKDIVYCSADGNYTQFITQSHPPILANYNLKHYTDLFSTRGFFRASRSYLVNIEHIASIHKKETIITSLGDHIHVSTRNKSALTSLIETLM